MFTGELKDYSNKIISIWGREHISCKSNGNKKLIPLM